MAYFEAYYLFANGAKQETVMLKSKNFLVGMVGQLLLNNMKIEVVSLELI